MTDIGMQIDWGARSTAEIVNAARLALQTPQRHAAPARPKARAAAAPNLQAAPAPAAVRSRRSTGRPGVFAFITAALVVAGVSTVWTANTRFASEMYDPDGLVPAVQAFSEGKNYAVFDLNLNIRRLRELHVAAMDRTPELVVLGASQWQEAHSELVKTRKMYDGHIHRDYWEDVLGSVEVYARHNRLPKQMIIAIRDNLFTPVDKRTDFLWEAGVDYYRAMADRLGIEKQSFWKTFPYQRVRERLSLSMLVTNLTRWYKAEDRPHATADRDLATLDNLLTDGSIRWSGTHKAIFTAERAEREASSFAERRRNSPPTVDPKGVAAVDAVLTFLKNNGTEVILAHPPFNPIYYDHVQGGTYMAGLENIRNITRKLAADHGLKIIGDFDPAKVGCTSAMFIDAEHSNPECLAKIFAQFDAINRAQDEAKAAGAKQ